MEQSYNLAPQAFLPWPVSVGIGLFLAWRGWKRRDLVLAVLAWIFFVPYIALYSLLLHFTLAAVRWPRVALLISAVMWLVYGGVLVWALLRL